MTDVFSGAPSRVPATSRTNRSYRMPSGPQARPIREPVRPVYATNGFNPPRPVGQAVRHGWAGRCPACGKGRLFHAVLEVTPACSACGEDFRPARVANAVPLLAVPAAVAAALLVAGILEEIGGVPLWLELLLGEGIALAVAGAILRRAKGALVGYAWSHHLGGFDPLRHLLPDPEGFDGAADPPVRTDEAA